MVSFFGARVVKVLIASFLLLEAAQAVDGGESGISKESLMQLDLSSINIDLSEKCTNQQALQAKQALLPGQLFNF